MEVYSVSQVTTYLREILEEDYDLQSLSVRGEISNASRASSGHWYFTLKDAGSQLRCVLWRSQAALLAQNPEDGASCIVSGRISLYEARGDLQLYVSDLQAAGRGELFRQYLESKARLQAAGVFDEEWKQPLPPYPRAIGIVTSPEAAALQDIRQVLRRRYPCARLILSPAPVQGAQAAPALRRALLALIAEKRADVILICRGGGSLEDLWPFNDEALARAVAESPLPIISGIGHETDITLVDFAADLRAPTPSAAAELATPDGPALRETIQTQRAVMNQRIEQLVAGHQRRLNEQHRALRRNSPAQRIRNFRQLVDDRRARIAYLQRQQLATWRERLRARLLQLDAVNPRAVLGRGYAYVTRAADGLHMNRAADLRPDETIDLHFQDGRRRARTVPDEA